jgi:hypothetical protein
VKRSVAQVCRLRSIERSVMSERATCKVARERSQELLGCFILLKSIGIFILQPPAGGAGGGELSGRTSRSESEGTCTDGRERGAGGGERLREVRMTMPRCVSREVCAEGDTLLK